MSLIIVFYYEVEPSGRKTDWEKDKRRNAGVSLCDWSLLSKGEALFKKNGSVQIDFEHYKKVVVIV